MAEKAEGNLLPITDQYHETIVIMMRHSTGVNHIAKNWSYQNRLVAYIKEEKLEIKTRKKYILSIAHFQRSAELYW